MTLLELTVVIPVLLSLVSILFIGSRAWRRGPDRANCILNISNMQQAMRSYANLNNLMPGGTVTGWKTKVVGSGLFVEKEPACPGGGTYTYALDTTIPNIGTLAISCSRVAAPDNHQPPDYSAW